MLYTAILSLGSGYFMSVLPLFLLFSSLKSASTANHNFLNNILRRLMSSKSGFVLPGFWIFQSAPNSVPYPASFPNTSPKRRLQSRQSYLFTVPWTFYMHPFFYLLLGYSTVNAYSPHLSISYKSFKTCFKAPLSPMKDLWRTLTTNDFLYL